MGVTGCNANFGQLSLLPLTRDLLEIPVTTRYKNKPVTEIKMEAPLLVKKLNERGITLKVVGGDLTCDSTQPIPKAIMTTINAEKKQLVAFLKGTATSDQQPTILVEANDNSTYHPAPTVDHAEKPAPSPATTTDSLPRLPWQLERLVSAASSGQLSGELSGVPDVQRYVMGWACSYLTGDRDEALKRLWQAHRAWKGTN